MSDSLNLTDKAVLITDLNKIIKGYNSHAKEVLQTDAIIGHPIDYFLDVINTHNGSKEKINDQVIYMFGNRPFNTHYEALISQMTFGFFTAHVNGDMIYRNAAFNTLFSAEDNNIFSIFKGSKIKISSFSIIATTKKDVKYDIALHGLHTYRLHLIPLLDGENTVSKVCGYFSDASDSDTLKTKLLNYEKLLDQSKFSPSKKAETDIKKPYLQLRSKYMNTLYALISNVSNKDITVLLLGKSGTGKSSIARHIHDNSLRGTKPFVTVNCTSLPENLIESELFGYEKGAFTGASSHGKKGLVEIAHEGTLFIDEIGEMPLYLQGKLLELLQDRTYRPIGSTTSKKADIRIIVATNKDLLGLVMQKKFREDLYYRIAVAIVNIPPLHERPDDVQTLLDAYMLYFNKKHDFNKKLSPEARESLLHYTWPGNIRELEHTIEFLMIRSDKNLIERTDLPSDVAGYKNPPPAQTSNCSMDSTIDFALDSGRGYSDYMDTFESQLISNYYDKYKSSYKVAKHLNISQTKANRLIRKYCKSF